MDFDGRKNLGIPNSEIHDFIKNKINDKYLYDSEIVKKFVTTYFEWIKSSTLNNLKGIEDFNQLSFSSGTSQSFDFFFASYKNCRMRCFKGDFLYHQLSWRNNYKNWKFLEEDEIREEDAVIISLPFSDFGSEHPETIIVLKTCEKLNVPVLIDCAYYSICRNLNFNLNFNCIKELCFSMSKAFYGTHRLRIGLRCKKEFSDDPLDVINSMEMLPKISAGIGYEICKNFSPDYNHNKYRKKQLQICKNLNIEPSDCVIYGITDKNHKRFGDFDRGSRWRRVCISELLGDMRYNEK